MPWDGLRFSLWRESRSSLEAYAFPSLKPFSVLCSEKKLSSRYVSLLALSTGPEASIAAQEIIQSANGIQMHANSCAHTQIRLQLSQELFANAGYHLNHYSALVATDVWSIWLGMRSASQTALESNGTLSQHQVTVVPIASRWEAGLPRLAVGMEQACWKMTLRSLQGKERPATNAIEYNSLHARKTQNVTHKVRAFHSTFNSSLAVYCVPRV